MALFSQYDPARIITTFRGTPLFGFMSGTFISITRTLQTFEMQAGASGDIVRRRIRDRSGSVTMTFQQSSPANDILNAALRQDELFGLGFGPFLMQDLNGLTLASAAISWVRMPAVIDLADTITGREWVLDCHDIDINVGGSAVIGL